MHQNQNSRLNPQLSANQFAEYLGASPVRRKGILKAARYQNSPAPIRYSMARKSIARFIASQCCDVSIIVNAIEYYDAELSLHYSGEKTLSEFAFSDYSLSKAALSAFLGSFNLIAIPGHTYTLGEHSPTKLMIGSLAISVRPDVIIQGASKTSKLVVGGVLLSFGKDAANKEPERKEFCSTAAALVHLYAEQELSDKGSPDRKFCLSLDIFGQKLHTCPNSYKSKKANMEAAAEEVCLVWPTI